MARAMPLGRQVQPTSVSNALLRRPRQRGARKQAGLPAATATPVPRTMLAMALDTATERRTSATMGWHVLWISATAMEPARSRRRLKAVLLAAYATSPVQQARTTIVSSAPRPPARLAGRPGLMGALATTAMRARATTSAPRGSAAERGTAATTRSPVPLTPATGTEPAVTQSRPETALSTGRAMRAGQATRPVGAKFATRHSPGCGAIRPTGRAAATETRARKPTPARPASARAEIR